MNQAARVQPDQKIAVQIPHPKTAILGLVLRLVLLTVFLGYMVTKYDPALRNAYIGLGLLWLISFLPTVFRLFWSLSGEVNLTLKTLTIEVERRSPIFRQRKIFDRNKISNVRVTRLFESRNPTVGHCLAFDYDGKTFFFANKITEAEGQRVVAAIS